MAYTAAQTSARGSNSITDSAVINIDLPARGAQTQLTLYNPSNKAILIRWGDVQDTIPVPSNDYTNVNCGVPIGPNSYITQDIPTRIVSVRIRAICEAAGVGALIAFYGTAGAQPV